MSGTRFLFITNDNRVFKINTPKNGIYQAIPQLANQLVLEVILHYETKDRKPLELIYVAFNRLELNSNGQYLFTQQEISDRSRNYVIFSLQTPETLSKNEDTLPIPSALAIPTQSEKESLKKYIKEHMPQLYMTGVYVIERKIQSISETNSRNLMLIKEAAKTRNINKQ